MENERIVVLDFGGQYKQLIARRVREQNVYCEIFPSEIGIEKLKELSPFPLNDYTDEKTRVIPELSSRCRENGIDVL